MINFKIFAITFLMIFVLINPAKSQSLGDCRVSAMYKYCGLIVAVAIAKADNKEEQAVAKKIGEHFDINMGKYSKTKGKEEVDTFFIKKAISDAKQDMQKTLMVCLGGNQSGLLDLANATDLQCRK